MPYCNNCGKQINPKETSCSGCGFVIPPTPIVTNENSEKIAASPTKRFTAGVIDIAIAAGLFSLLFFVKGSFLAMLPMKKILAIAAPHLYLLFKDSVQGKSVGKLITGLTVRDRKTGKPGNILDSIIRNFYLSLPFVGPTLIALLIGAQILSGKNKRLGDSWAGTIVTEDEEKRELK